MQAKGVFIVMDYITIYLNDFFSKYSMWSIMELNPLSAMHD